VFDALTTAAGIAGWWAPATGSGVEGGELRLTFDADDPLVLQVATAQRPSTVVWAVKSCDFLPDWVGTRPTFALSRSEAGGSEVQFRRHGLTPHLECYNTCRAGWDHYLPSLRRYVESGRGSPSAPGRSRSRSD
jgi:uncharacterized protein YndB with AHSA1/START domain